MVALDVTTVSHMAPGRFFRDHTSAVNARYSPGQFPKPIVLDGRRGC